MSDKEQLIAVAEVLGKRGTVQEIPLGDWWRKLPPYLTSLDACFADIVPWMRKEGWMMTLETGLLPDTQYFCQFQNARAHRITASSPTAPRAIVKAFLIYNNRWVDQPDNQRKGDWRESTDSKPLIIP